jgi:leucyl-tRNA---protein transferase
MHEYLSWAEQTIIDFSDEKINSLYDEGYVFTRVGKGVMRQTRSIRIDLSKFELSSENRRVLKKTEDLRLKIEDLPYGDYHWLIGKLAKDFYDTKFGEGTFSANKVKELMTDESKSNFNLLIQYVIPSEGSEATEVEESLLIANTTLNTSKRDPSTSSLRDSGRDDNTVGYAICYETKKLLHYSYPFYILQATGYTLPNIGLGMMLHAILYAKEQNEKYIYLGSAQRPTDVYKLQFKGLEWFDGNNWKTDLEELKNILHEK